jgi:hypothetical protein
MMPLQPQLARAGSWDGEDYEFKGVMLVGAEPASSPFTRAFEASAIPRIRSTPDRAVDNGSADWLDRLRSNPDLRYVSDGNPEAITVPAGREAEVAERFRGRVQTR